MMTVWLGQLTNPSRMGDFWSPEHDVSPDLARALIASQFPDLVPERIERFGSGMDNIAYLVDQRWIFRFPRRSVVAPLLETETAVLPLIAAHVPVPIPVPQFVGKPQAPYPWMFAGYDVLAGTTACSVELSDDDRARLAPALGKILGALHRIDPGQALALGLPGDAIGRMDHARRFPLAQERLSDLKAGGYLSNAMPLLAFMEANAPSALLACSIVHGDLYARHVLVDSEHTISGIIDWGDVHFGHPAADVMVAHTMLPSGTHASFVEAYGGVDPQTWAWAKYRAIYHSVLVAHYGVRIADSALARAGLSALQRIGATL
jgi:aminoglycoside phosphotransferase (APT) family kinase protein